jgi:hypothetical protein
MSSPTGSTRGRMGKAVPVRIPDRDTWAADELTGYMLRITYMNTSAFALYLLPFSLRWLYRRRGGDGGQDVRRSGYEPLAVDAAQALSESVSSVC